MEDADTPTFVRALCAIVPLDEADIQAARALMRPRELQAGHYFLRAGEMASEVAIVVRGLLREHFVMADGSDRTKAFVTEGQPTGSLADLLSGVPSRAFIVAEEPTRVLVGRFDEVVALAERSDGLRRYGVRLMQRLLLSKCEREYEFLGLDAEARYATFQARYPGLEQRIAGYHVASYLGITPVHLSRLRRRRAAARQPMAADR